MTTRYLVDSELVALIERVPAFPLTAETLPLIRTSLKEMMTQTPADLPDFVV